jgi:hypothetical protein
MSATAGTERLSARTDFDFGGWAVGAIVDLFTSWMRDLQLSAVSALKTVQGVQGGDKTINWSAAVCGRAGGVKVGHWIG